MANLAANPPVVRPTRSRFASEDRIGEAQFYPAGSPPSMHRRGTETPSERPYYQTTDRYVDSPRSYVPHEQDVHYEPSEPTTVAVKPKKKNKIKQLFSRLKGKKKTKQERNVVKLDTPERPLPPSPYTEELEPPSTSRYQAPPSEISSQRYQLRDPGFVPRRMSITTSRDESLRARETARASTRDGSVFGPPPTAPIIPPAENGLFGPPPTRPTTTGTPSVITPQRWTEHSGEVYEDRPPTPMLVDERSGNQVPRDVSYASTGTVIPPKKKKRSLGSIFKRIFTRKKKRVSAERLTTVVEPDPVIHEERYVEEVVYDEPVTTVPPARTAHSSTRSSAVSSAHRPAVVVRPGSRTHSAQSVTPPRVIVPVKPPSSRVSPVPVVLSPRSSHSHSEAQEPVPEVVIPISPRDSISLRRGTSSPIAQPRRYDTGSSIPAPRRYNTGNSLTGLARHGTNESVRLGRQATTSTTGGRTVPISTAPVVSRVTSSTNSPSPSIRTGDSEGWGEVHLPPEPAPVPPVTSRPGGLGIGTRPLGGAKPAAYRPAPRAPRRTYAAPPPRKPYVHVPRTIPPPPRYPSLPTRILPATSGTDAQVQMIVTALRDLAAEERHRTAVTEQRLAEERAWNEEERQRDAELRALIAQLVARNGSRTTVDEFGVREGFRTPTAAARGLGVGGSDIERLLEIMRQGHEVTMQTFRDMIDRWRHDIDTNHQRFLAEQTARQEARERRREKPIRWQPGVNIWEPNY
ncbi:hypothetical protein RSOLAG22IIIB_07359 [Rhizoctonia solani]|uniref:Uncharacterized protein n=1 Tax=Rhizoctonia solani TaxID=456999 RepID=A0A0K6FMG6_9AGAM|nr:hypothetical protein RSOLAG22IIIB_07359 [Rhizoctonia solani]